MSKSLVIILVVVAAFLFGAIGFAVFGGVGIFTQAIGQRGSGDIVTEIRDVDGFDSVETCCGLKLNIQQDASTKVTITGDDNLLPEIQTTLRGDTLLVKWNSAVGGYHPTQSIVVDVTMPSVTGVKISGGATFESADLTGDSFTLESSGGGRTQIGRLEVDEFTLESSGGGNTSIQSGQVTEQTVRLSGGDKYDAADLMSEKADINVSGGSRAVVWVTDSMVLKASGGGGVTYYGSPTVEQNVSGGSKVESMGER